MDQRKISGNGDKGHDRRNPDRFDKGNDNGKEQQNRQESFVVSRQQRIELSDRLHRNSVPPAGSDPTRTDDNDPSLALSIYFRSSCPGKQRIRFAVCHLLSHPLIPLHLL